jgi:general secretion pathway protein I
MISLPCSGSRRRGLTLLEVLIALGIFLTAFAVLSRLVTLGADRALEVQQQAQAAQLCQAKLAEVAAGIVPLSGQNDVPFDEAPNFLWSVDAAQADTSGLWKVTVRVTLQRSDGSRVECSLDRMLLDPSLRGNAMDAALAAASNSSNSSSNGSSTSGSSGSSSGTGSSASSGSGAASAASASTSKTGAATGSASGASAPKSTTGSSSAPSSSGSKAGSASKGGN